MKKLIKYRYKGFLFLLSLIAYTLFFELNRILPININWLFRNITL